MSVPESPTGRLLDSPVKKNSGKTLDAHTFLITLSPKEDIHPDCVKAVVKWIRKNATYSYVVIETGTSGKRHLHASLTFATARSKQRLQEDLFKYRVKPHHSTSIGKFAVVVTNQYDHKWYDEYLRKETDVELLVDDYVRDSITPLFPTLAQQEHFQALKGKKPLDTVLFTHCGQWEKTEGPFTVAGALYYLRVRMFQLKDMVVIQDDRRVRQLALALYRYQSGDCAQSMEDDEWLNRSDPSRGALYQIHPTHIIPKPSLSDLMHSSNFPI